MISGITCFHEVSVGDFRAIVGYRQWRHWFCLIYKSNHDPANEVRLGALGNCTQWPWRLSREALREGSYRSI